MLNFTASTSSSSICKDHSLVTILITLKETFTLATWFTRIPNGFALKRARSSLGFGRPLAALELVKDFGYFSEKFHFFCASKLQMGLDFTLDRGFGSW